MNVDDRVLMSYVDGQLSVDARVAAEATMVASTDVAVRVAALRASCLPYRAAFEHGQQPAIPTTLVDRVDQLVTVSRGPRQADAGKSLRLMLASLAAGIVFCTATLGSPPSMWAPPSVAEPWIEAVADYQSLYGRETVETLSEDSRATETALARLRQTMAPRLNIPNLLPHGLVFKRLQQLDFQGQPLVQVVYLPQTGKPVALCIIEEAKPDKDVRVQPIAGMQSATWRRDHLAYVLLTPNPAIDIDRVAREIASGTVASSYGDLPQPSGS